jgi:hypothetical protein
MERAGVPTVTIVTERFEALGRAVAESLDLPSLPLLVIPHPFGGLPAEDVRERGRLVADQLPEALREAAEQAPSPDAAPAQLPPDVPVTRLLKVSGTDVQEFSWELLEAGLTDGLPVVPPTPERVEAMLSYCDRDPAATIGPLPPVWRQLTVEAAAANAVMAGCRPEHFPVVLQAVEAMLAKPSVNFFGMQATTHPIGPMIMFSGPLAAELGIASGAGCLGPGPWANGSVGRALRLVCMNGGGAYPGDLDKATLGQPAKFAFCFAENEADSPWGSYRSDHGFPEEQTTITLVGAEAPLNINDHGSTNAEGILRTISGTLRTNGNNNLYWLGDAFVIIGPEHAATLDREGIGKAELQEEIHRRARVPVDGMSEGQFAHILSWIGPDDLPSFVDSEGNLALTRTPQDIHIVVAGGPGKHSMWIPTWFRSVTVAIADAEGRPVTSIEQLRRKDKR